MSFDIVLFYGFSSILILASLGVVASRNAVHSALSLILAFFTTAGIWLLLEAEFLAMTLVLVYVGAVMVLFLFVIMMLDVNAVQAKEGYIKYLPVAVIVAIVIAVEMFVVLADKAIFGLEQFATPVRHAADYSNTEELGKVLYTDYMFQFEIAAVILLVAIVAAIVLTLRRRAGTRYQDPSTQVLATKSERLHIIKIKAEGQE